MLNRRHCTISVRHDNAHHTVYFIRNLQKSCVGAVLQTITYHNDKEQNETELIDCAEIDTWQILVLTANKVTRQHIYCSIFKIKCRTDLIFKAPLANNCWLKKNTVRWMFYCFCASNIYAKKNELFFWFSVHIYCKVCYRFVRFDWGRLQKQKLFKYWLWWETNLCLLSLLRAWL